MRAGNYHEKEYLVSVNKPVTEEFCRKMSRGVAILDTVTRPCKVEKTRRKKFSDHFDTGIKPADSADV